MTAPSPDPPTSMGDADTPRLVRHGDVESFLAERRAFCALFTDLANPTSNAIYARIGYRPLADYAHYRFEEA